MTTVEAQEYADLVIEQLHSWGILPSYNYGKITEDQRQELAQQVADKSEE